MSAKLIAGCVALALGVLPAAAQTVPKDRSDVAYPGGTLPSHPKVSLVKIAGGFLDPIGVASAFDGTGRLFVVERIGRVRIVNKDGSVQPEPFIDLTKINPLGNDVQTGFVEQGLWSIAFHPKFKENGYVFLHYASLPFNGASMILRVTVDPKSPNVVSADQINKSAKVIMNIPQPYYNHMGGGMEFGPDGYLYIGKGDGGWEGDPLDSGQRRDTLLGKILRIDVNTPDDSVPYLIPKSNPLATAATPRLMSLFGVTEEQFSKIQTRALPEIWAYGLRNPWQIHFNKKTGDLFIADVGQNTWENVFWQPHDSNGGENYGWKLNAGAHCFPITSKDTTCPQVGVLPIANYAHPHAYPGAPEESKDTGCSVIGLGVDHDGNFLFGDWCSGRLWGVAWDSSKNKWQMQELLQSQLQFTGGNDDEDGSILATNCYCFYTSDKGAANNPPGALWRIMPTDKVPPGAETAKVLKTAGN
jgi:glucose/arabinose dehydrogenase